MTQACRGPIKNETYTRCELDLNPCPVQDYNRLTFGQVDVEPLYYQTLYLTDISFTSYQHPPEVVSQLHIGVSTSLRSDPNHSPNYFADRRFVSGNIRNRNHLWSHLHHVPSNSSLKS